MNRHQVLTGAVNAGDHCYSVGSVEGVPFTAYGAGCNIVILASNFERVQIIPGYFHGNVQVGCIECSTDIGKVAASYGRHIAIFEPSPILHQSSPHKLDYKWVQTATIEVDYVVTVLSWNLEGTTLLAGGDYIQMWCYSAPSESTTIKEEEEGVTFHLGSDAPPRKPSLPVEEKSLWDCVWKCRTSQPVNFLKFSQDGTLFASAGKTDRLVKIWHESQRGNRSQNGDKQRSFSFVYLAHPRAVTGVSWRKTSKFMPRGSVANMVVTSCRDNICRLWVQTLLPEDGLVNLQQIEALAGQTPRLQTQRHRQRIVHKLKHMKSFNEYKRRQAAQSNDDPKETIPTLPSTYSVHDFHSFGLQGCGVAPGLHFHLAASINAETDIPLVPSLSSSSGARDAQEPNFVLHWLNNKEMAFSHAAEELIQELSLKAIQTRQEALQLQHLKEAALLKQQSAEDGEEGNDKGAENEDAVSKTRFSALPKRSLAEDALTGASGVENVGQKQQSPTSSSASVATETSAKNAEQSLGDALDRKIEALLREWHRMPDLLFSIHPVDGSFLVWLVEWLDECSPGTFRQAMVSFSSRIPGAIPLGDAATLSHHLPLYLPNAGLDLRTVLQGLAAVDAPPSPNIQSAAATAAAKLLPGGTAAAESPTSPVADLGARIHRAACCQVSPSPTICMLSKHNNGSLNLWHVTFGEDSNFTHVLSIGHASRVSGHRFRINDITCHPVLPLLLTTSHHNLPRTWDPLSVDEDESSDKREKDGEESAPDGSGELPIGFCSELILWKVEPVGPLSKSGGIAELARINSLEPSAFSNVAWVPTLLPSTTLGSISNSPSACFVASDGKQLRVYQAVIDARTLLAEVLASCRKENADGNCVSSTTSSGLDYRHAGLQDNFKIVSLQSTARPGCIIELDAISEATHDWQNTQLLHVFQEQLIAGVKHGSSSPASGTAQRPGARDEPGNEELLEKNVGLLETSYQAFVDLRHSAVFEEPFYLVVLEKEDGGRSVLHMWRILIASQTSADATQQAYAAYVPDSNIVQENDHSNESTRSNSPDAPPPSATLPPSPHASPLRITTTKVCTHELPLPPDVEIAHATPAAGHVSSSNIYPACFAPYILCTACTDGLTRFWKCRVEGDSEEERTYTWIEWEMTLNKSSSAIKVPGQPLCVSCAYSGRVACAFKHGHSFTRPSSANPTDRFVNISVAIYECESTGGSEWILEDTVHLKNFRLPKLDKSSLGLDLNSLYDTTLRNRKTVDSLVQKLASDGDLGAPPSSLQRLLAVPSYATLHTLRQAVIECGNQNFLLHKSLVQLDWVSSEDGSHVLTVAVGQKVMLFTPVSSDIAQANLQAMNACKAAASRPLLKQASSMAPPTSTADTVRWMQIRCTRLETADGLPPLPMQLSWVRDGILVVGMDSEMHIYSQWKPQLKGSAGQTREREEEDVIRGRLLAEEDLLSRAQEVSQLRLSPATGPLARSASSSQALDKKKPGAQLRESNASSKATAAKESETVLGPMPDLGLFETCRLACPVLPQYHPKQLMELLGFGKIRRVKAILSHLVRCISKANQARTLSTGGGAPEGAQENEGEEGGEDSLRAWSRTRTLSLAAPAAGSAAGSGAHTPNEGPGVVPEEVQLDYVEIQSIPPLPLFALLAADKQHDMPSTPRADASPGAADGVEPAPADQNDYSSLFESAPKKDKGLDDFLEEDTTGSGGHQKKEKRISDKNLNQFGTRQARLLTQLLTHCHLPGLSSLDQMHLLALADTIASFHATLADRFDSEIVHATAKDTVRPTYEMTMQATTDSLDDCGLRYFLAVRHHTYLLRCLPLVQRKQLQRQGLGPHHLVWAFHSETQEELVQLIPAFQKANTRWAELKELGVAWWVRSNQLLRKIIEKVAKSSFQAHSNPLDASLYYMALKKKNIIAGLYRSINDKKMSDFFQNNFSLDRWRKAALKNAYVLLGKQQFEHAAAFFLLAGSVKDAVQVCLNNLDDLQLAMMIVRLHEGDLDSTPEHVQRLLHVEILGCSEDGSDEETPSLAHPSPFLRSMAYWQLQHYEDALTTLLQTGVGECHHRASKLAKDDDTGSAETSSNTADPGVFNFYLYLRTHPLVVRRNLARNQQREGSRRHARAIMVSGFKQGTHSKSLSGGGTDTITPLERRLFFTTSHAHFRAGCPPLALEVLSRLPNCVLDNGDEESMSPTKSTADTPLGKLPGVEITAPQKSSDFDWSQPLTTTAQQKSTDFDWSQPVAATKEQKASDFDWSMPLASTNQQKAADFDWGMPLSSLDQPTFSLNGPKEEEEDKGIELSVDERKGDDDTQDRNLVETLDIMAQQLKFMACLKIMMEELSTLATGFEVDGGQLRYQLYVWLERCVAALKELCHYGATNVHASGSVSSETSILPDAVVEAALPTSAEPGNTATAPTLHEILVADKQDFEAKLVRAAKRKLWLKANEALLRTLLSYTSLHGAHGGGLAAVRMELNLLLQELQQDRSQQQLLSPLPFPTTLPLLAASVACQKTVVADPIRHLQLMAHDILHTLIEMPDPPLAVTSAVLFSRVSVLWDLSMSLSACIYQALCDSDSFSGKLQGINRALDVEDCLSLSVVYQNSHLLAGHAQRRQRTSTSEEPLRPTTAPSKWPGVQSLRALMARDKDEDAPRLHTLLCESFVAVYLSQLIHALAACDCHVLFRLVGQRFTQHTWSMLYGGGAKKLLRVSTASAAQTPGSPAVGGGDKESTATVETGIFDAITRQRVKWNMRILPQLKSEAPQTNIREDRPTYRELFVPPVMSMMSCFMTKPTLPDHCAQLDYDSAESLPSSDDDAGAAGSDEEMGGHDDDVFSDPATGSASTKGRRRESQASRLEQLDSGSYAWALMRYAIARIANRNIREFLSISGIELQELPVTSPLLHASLRVLEHWLRHLREALEAYGGPPANFLPNSCVEASTTGPPILKYKVMLELDNTPFRTKHPATLPTRRLWNYLIRQEEVQEIFIRYIFSHKVGPPPQQEHPVTHDPIGEGDDQSVDGAVQDPIRIIHKDQESISTFCVSQVTEGILALATPKELQELDISVMLEPLPWLEDEAEFDILNIARAPEAPPVQAMDFLVIQHPADRMTSTGSHGSGGGAGGTPTFNSPTNVNPPPIAAQTGRGTTLPKGLHFPGSSNPLFCQFVLERSHHMIKPLKRHRIDSVRRLCSHPVLPVYLSGSQDGSVSLWEWGHSQPVSTPRLSGTFAKVTSIQFNQQGNKFGVTDADGNLSLWQVGITSPNARPFFSSQCHSKQASDFAFISSSSLIATAGYSAENRNVCIWDTLLPLRKALVSPFHCHEHGSAAVVFAPQNQLLISAGKKGDVAIIDVRQRQIRHKFQAHDTAIKCLTLDPKEEYYITGSADGDIKVWGLSVHLLLYAFPNEHSRSTLFRNIGMGVTHLYTDSHGRLFSCGADGSMKLRQLPERDVVVASLV
ncbi:dmX-like protein 2 [Ornithodoros turicata]|uniref:dmX-like protein 2 n=1 Tax=Ornithodoros turicata TaxID=34597 RepID=UPI003138E12E